MAAIRPAGDFDRSYEHDMAIVRQRWQLALLLGAIAFVLTVPLWGTAYLVGTLNEIAITIIALQGLNLLTGYTGQISLGHAAFMLVGGYLSALLVIHTGLPLLLALPAAALGTGLVGLLFGLPSLRVKGFYLAMATLSAQFIIPWLSRRPALGDYLGGTSGRIEVPPAEVFGIILLQVDRFVYLSLFVLLVTTILTVNLTRSRLGRAFISVRDNDLAAELLGVNLYGYKLRAFFLAATLAGASGALFAHQQRGIGTEFGYDLTVSIILLGMLVIGGLGTNIGPFLGAAAVVLLEDVANLAGGQLAAVFPDQASTLLTSFRPIFFGLALMLFLIFEPRGLAHRWELIKAGWRLRPFGR